MIGRLEKHSDLSEALATGIVERHGSRILLVARRFSQTSADAEDAYQRSLEKLLTKAPDEDEDGLVGWLMTVVRNEALMICRRNKIHAADPLENVDALASLDQDGPGELALEREEIAHGREAFDLMHPDQVRCLLLRADGLGYPEICKTTGFSYPKVNRCLTEGRKAFRTRVAAIASGSSCDQLFPEISRFVDGEADQDAIKHLRAHLKHCGSCRATVREFRAAPKRVAAVFPIGVTMLEAPKDMLARLGDSIGGVFTGLQERLAGGVTGVPQAAEMATVKKVALVTLVSASVVTGGVGVQKAVTGDSDAGAEQPRSEALIPRSEPTTPAAAPNAAPDGNSHRAKTDRPRAANERDVEGPERVAVEKRRETIASPGGASVGEDADFASPSDPAATGDPLGGDFSDQADGSIP